MGGLEPLSGPQSGYYIARPVCGVLTSMRLSETSAPARQRFLKRYDVPQPIPHTSAYLDPTRTDALCAPILQRLHAQAQSLGEFLFIEVNLLGLSFIWRTGHFGDFALKTLDALRVANAVFAFAGRLRWLLRHMSFLSMLRF